MPEMIGMAGYRAKIYDIVQPDPEIFHCKTCGWGLKVPAIYSKIKITGMGSLNLKCKCGRLNEYKGN